jgi:hypothetical protein
VSGALTWRESDIPRARNVDRDRSTTIGRSEAATVHLSGGEVSREHAEIHFDGQTFVIANRSRTNPTFVNGQPTVNVVLRDQDEVSLGGVQLRFHDLGAHDAISGLMCSHCMRENEAIAKDCWYCGTSLVSAPSSLRTRRPVVGRIVSETGEFLDLFAGQSASLDRGRPLIRHAPNHESAEGSAIEVSATDDGLTIADTLGDVRRLTTGDIVDAPGARFVIIIR